MTGAAKQRHRPQHHPNGQAPAADICLGNLDWGRGVWEYRSFRLWASVSGFVPDRRTVGLNLGFGFGDTSAATENTLSLDGRIHTLDQVDWRYDPANHSRPLEKHACPNAPPGVE